MKTRILGKTGFKVSEIGLGCWQLGNDFGDLSEQDAQAILDQAHTSNISFWDTADVYGSGLSETRIGNWLKQNNQSASKPIVITKVGRDAGLYPDKYSKQKVKLNLESSIKRLQVEALDLVQLHCVPPDILFAGELLSWMEEFQQQGLIKHFGASVETIEEAEFCLTQSNIASLQIIFNIFRQDATKYLLKQAAENQVGIIARLPLASGLLSGKMSADRQFSQNDHRNYNKDGDFFNVGETFNGLALHTGVDLANELKASLPGHLNLHQVAMRWILDQPEVTSIIAGTTQQAQVIANAQISDLAQLPADLHKTLANFYQTKVKQHIRGQI
ncbi:aldo/keto reductase [Catenovulum maritimum]|uniref:Aldo/keto reductase n=1 Tax=Catenovulum maritimum TaxID=1513271 RepID=A0A0J8GQ82_9ALTE|nr:aldo/keto reductase [Catenovulum maritimum]KMT64935.1 aldo/keto reductase [Catenovulum maritimum]